jgi:hypothetical protein
MQIQITRTYHPRGTNGLLFINGRHACYTIELPWRDNEVGRSCIPEGSYPVVKRFSEKFQNHLLVTEVPGRTLILFHPANNAIKQLRGCIAPVSTLTAPGCGLASYTVFQQLVQLAYAAIAKGQPVTLTIVSAAQQQVNTGNSPAPVISLQQKSNACQTQLQAA